MPKIVIEDIIFKPNSQSISRRVIINQNGIKIKFSIKVDSHSPQSYARSYIFDSSKSIWNEVYSIPHSLMQTMHGLEHSREDEKQLKKYFDKDLSNLIDKTAAILG